MIRPRREQHEPRIVELRRRARNNGFRYERPVSGSETNSRTWVFTVAGESIHPRALVDRFTELAQDIREIIAETLRVTEHQSFMTAIQIIPYGAALSTGNYHGTKRNLAGITGDYLHGQYEGIVKSDETVEFEGLEIRITQLLDRSGNATKTGKVLPQHLKGVGLWQHPDTGKIPVDAPCGLVAFLLGFDEEYYKDYQLLLKDAEEYAVELGFDIMMSNRDFQKIVELPEFYDQRIVIFRIKGSIEHIVKGKNWIFNGDTEKGDSNTVCLYRDTVFPEKHYYWVKFPKQLGCFNKHTNHVKCHQCYRSFSEKSFPKHKCSGGDIYKCNLCETVFFNQENLDDHSRKSTSGWNCEFCHKKEFSGRDCFDKHVTNCFSEKKEFCEECCRFTPNKYTHSCIDFGGCKHCNVVFSSPHTHQCVIQPETKFYETLQASEKQKRITWNSHWFYDFETTRGREYSVNEEPVYVHEVMAWCVQLMVPDDETEQFLDDEGIIEHMMSKLFDLNGYNDIEYDNPSEYKFWIRGKELKSFIYVCENILSNKKPAWKPTLWAHNGSKFDAKFILDYYLNELGLDMIGSIAESDATVPDKNGGWKLEKNSKSMKRGDFVKPSIIGSKILSLNVRGIVFRCSYAHIAQPLRKLPKSFGLKDLNVKKGEFPYGRLQRDNWGKILPAPTLEEFHVDAMGKDRRKEVIAWHNGEDSEKPWNFDEELWGYLHADVEVGAKCMEAYHRNSIELHKPLWEKTGETKLCSPLGYSTSPSWAFGMYRSWFLPEIHVLDNDKTQYVRDSLRGGRTDKRCSYMKITPEQRKKGDKLMYYDFKSLYPSVQKCQVHDTHFPIGPGKWITFSGPTCNEKLIRDMGDRTGFLTISCEIKKYVTHPTLHRVYDPYNDDSKKLIFDLKDKNELTYAWPELLEAIRCGEIEITYVYKGLVFEKSTNVFNDYVDFFFAQKEKGDREKNEGARSLAKLLLNSLWGKLGQRSYPVREWVKDEGRLDYLLQKFENNAYEMTSLYVKDNDQVHVQYKIGDDHNNRLSTAPHIAAFVSMWGRVILHQKLLSVHGMRALYCDTDSAIVYLRPGDEMPFVGDELGDLVDEMPKMAKDFSDPYISQVVCLAPKTYALEITDGESGQVCYKVTSKGFEPSHNNSVLINFNSFKELVFTQYDLNTFFNGKRGRQEDQVEIRHSIMTDKGLQFISSIARNQLCPAETLRAKTITGKYTKGKVHRRDPRFIEPFGELCPPEGTFLTNSQIKYE